MEHLHFQPDEALADASFDQHFDSSNYYTNTPGSWPLALEHSTMPQNHLPSSSEESRPHTISTSSSLDIRTSMPTVTGISPLQTAGFAYSQAFVPSAMLTANDLSYGLMAGAQTFNPQEHTMLSNMAFNGTYGLPLHQSPVDELVAAHEGLHNNSMESSFMQSFPMDGVPEMAFPQFQDINSILANTTYNMSGAQFPTSVASHSPQETWLSRSLSNGSERSWTFVERTSMDGYPNQVVSPQNLHVRTDSNSSSDSDAPPLSARSTGSYVDVGLFNVSPEPEHYSHEHFHDHVHDHSHDHFEHVHGLPMPSPLEEYRTPVPLQPTASSVAVGSSPTSSGQSCSPDVSVAGSPKTKRRNSPISPAGVTQKTIVKKKPVVSAIKEKAEKKVGKRKGPLRPEQRQQAHEIRKLRACLRCKFLKKVCDKGDPCSGCKPSHARLWQVPCTRLAIQDIAFFLKGWQADHERHITMQVSIANIKGFSPYNRELCITHGYGYMFRVRVREVYLVDDKDLDVDWIESIHEQPRAFAMQTARLSADNDGISRHHLSQYVEQHLFTFEKFVDEYFESTPFLMDMLKTIYRFYVRTQNIAIKKGLKLVIAYALTLHITMIHPESDDDFQLGVIDDDTSRYYGKVISPVMINFQVKKAMADLWREYMKDVLEELSSLYSSVYSGEKLKNWPIIFMLASMILAVWEMMQFDQYYRVPDQAAVTKFIDEMENVPVGVIVGLFSAISTKTPQFLEWDSRKHSKIVLDNGAVCDTMTEVRAHVEKHEQYLRARPAKAVYDREDFDSLSNKFLSKLVIRSTGPTNA